MRKLAPLLAWLTLMSGACASVQSDAMPDCGLEHGSAALLLAQSVPTAELVPCVTELPPGWDLSEVATGDDGATMRFSSDRLGHDFLEVEFGDACPADPAATAHVVPGGVAWLSQDVVEQPAAVAVTIVITAPRHTAYGAALAAELRRADIPAELAPSDDTVGSRIDRASADGRFVVLVDEVLREVGDVEIIDPAGNARVVADDEAVEELARLAAEGTDETYRGSWQFRFDGGCVVYLIDAAGPGAAGLADAVAGALSFVSRSELRRFTWSETGLLLDG